MSQKVRLTSDQQRAREMKRRLREAFAKKLKESEEYVDEMLATADGQTPAECGVDPEHNVDEIIKDLELV